MSQKSDWTRVLLLILFCVATAIIWVTQNEVQKSRKLLREAAELMKKAETAKPPAPVTPQEQKAGEPPAPIAACPPNMIAVSGNYCTKLTHFCLKGYETIGGPWMDYGPLGVSGVNYCEQFVEGKSVCEGKEVPMQFCIDRYEYPNQAGAVPQVLVSWAEATAACESRGERLCGDDEWTLACEGPERMPYPYGWKRDEQACNINRGIPQDVDRTLFADPSSYAAVTELARVSRLVPSGSMPTCVSPFGVSDMTGNGDEWCNNVTAHNQPHSSVLKGGHWMGKVRSRCRPTTVDHDEHYRDFVQGFRCCSDPLVSQMRPQPRY